MRHHNFDVVFQEVPGEISLCFNISGCSIRCKGCHSPYLWNRFRGEKLTKYIFSEILKKYKNYATCVLFMGGEWYQKELINRLKLAQESGYKTCLYTGEETIDDEIKKHLTWLKTGKWEEKMGGLDNLNTNQKFIEIKTDKKLNYLFIKTN